MILKIQDTHGHHYWYRHSLSSTLTMPRCLVRIAIRARRHIVLRRRARALFPEAPESELPTEITAWDLAALKGRLEGDTSKELLDARTEALLGLADFELTSLALDDLRYLGKLGGKRGVLAQARRTSMNGCMRLRGRHPLLKEPKALKSYGTV